MPVINGVYLKDFTALPSSVTDANIIPIAITGNQIAYRTTVAGIVTDARVTSKLLTGLSITGSAILATDTILQAFGKVQNQINGKQGTITLTTTGTNGPATLVGSTLNIPNYADGGVLSLSAIGAVPNANAATITGTVLNLQPASASFGGVVTTLAQTFAGDKTLTGALIGTTGSFTSNGGSDTFSISHSSGAGIALNITKGGNGEGIYVNKTSGSGNAVTIIGTLNATTLVKSGGTSAQFLKADGTVDSTAYGTGSVTSVAALTLGTTGTDLSSTVANGTTTPVITLNVPDASATARGLITTGTQTIAGQKTFSTGLTGTLTGSASLLNGYSESSSASINTIARRDANGDIVARTYFMSNGYGDFAPNKLVGTGVDGQIREMSQAQALSYLNISGTYLPLAGGTLTGALSGTSATFTGTTASGVVKGIATSGFGVSGEATSGNAVTGNATTGVGGIFIANATGGVGLIADSYTGVIAKFQASGSDKVTISNTGALSGTSATFSGAVTINNATTIDAGNGNQLVLDNAGERFTQMDYYNNGSGKAVTYWDNTNNWFQIITTPASSKIRAVAQTNGVELANGGTSWSSLSDIREKTIIRPIQDALTTLKDYRTVIGRYNTDLETVERAFLIAQDVQMTYPYAVTEDDDADKTLRLSYTELIPLMIKAIQELKLEIDILKNN